MKLRNTVDAHAFQWSIAAAALAAYAISWGLQTFLHLIPCPLCLYARAIWKMATIFAFLGAIIPPVNSMPKLNGAFYALTMAWLIAAFGLALGHAGIEWHWWGHFITTCTVDPSTQFGVTDTIQKSCADADYIHVGKFTSPVSLTVLSLIYAAICLLWGIAWRLFNNCKKKTLKSRLG